MKHKRIVIALVLLVSLLLSSCGQAFPRMTQTALLYAEAAPKAFSEPAAKAEEEKAPALETAAEAPALLSAFREAPADVQTVQPMALAGGKVEPIRVTTDMFRAKFEGSDVAGSGEAVDGVYRFAATKTDGEAWHVKLECNYPTVAGRDYRISYRFHSDVAGKVKFGDFQEFEIREGDNSLTGILTASSGTSYLDLQLGMLPPFTIDFSEIEVEEYADEVDYENALPSPVNFERETLVFEKHDQGYAPVLTRSKDGVSVEYLATSWDSGIWKSRLYIRTGLIPESGVHYRVTADIKCDQDMPFEVLFNNGDEEKGYGALYGQNLTAGETKTCEAVITGSGDGDDLVMQFSLGEVPEGSTVKIDNLRVDKIKDHYTNELPAHFALDTSVATGKTLYGAIPTSFKNLPLTNFSYSGTDTVYEGHDDDYEVNLEENGSSATLNITRAPESGRGVWKVRLYAATGVELEAGTTYQISFDLASKADQANYEVLLSGDTDEAYGADKDRSLTAGGTDHAEFLVTPDESHGPLTIRLQLGETDTTAGNSFTLSNLSVKKAAITASDVLPADFSYTTPAAPSGQDPEYVNVLPDSFSYRTGVNVHESHADGYEQSVSADGSSATLSITSAPAGGEVYSSLLLIETGFTPQPRTKYTVSLDVSAAKAQDLYEICFDGNSEKEYGAEYGLSLAAGSQTVAHSFFAKDEPHAMTIKLQLGKTNGTDGNTVTVSNIRITPVSFTGTSAVADSLVYPTSGSTEPTYEEVPLVNPSVSKGVNEEGYDLSLEENSLTFNQAPSLEGWKAKLYYNTGITPEAGAEYRVTANVTATKATVYDVCYENGSDEKGYGAEYGLNILGDGTVVHTFTAPAEGLDPLVLQFQLGRSAAGNTFRVNSVTVEKKITQTTTEVPVDLTLSYGDPWGLDVDGYSVSGSGNIMSITAVPEEDAEHWKAKLYIDTGFTPEAGASYKVTTSISATKAMDYAICYDKGTVEKGYGDEFTHHAGEGAHVVTHSFTAPTADLDPLVLQLQLGKSPADNTITVNSVSVVKVVTESTTEPTYEEVPLVNPSVSKGVNEEGYDLSLEENSLTFNQAPSLEGWKAKLYYNTGITPEAGAEYRVTANVTATKATVYDVCYENGSDEKGYGAEYGLNILGDGTVVHTFTAPAEGLDPLVLQFQLGRSAAGNTFRVNSVTVEKKTVGGSGTNGSFEAWGFAESGYGTALSGDGSSATITLSSAPESGREVWKAKLFANTGVTLEKGKCYRISADVRATGEFPYEICYNNGGTEKGVDAKYGLTASTAGQTVTQDVMADDNANLVLQFSLGNAAAGTAVTVSNVKVEELVETAGDAQTISSLVAWAPVHAFADNGYALSLSNTASSATAAISSVPASDQADWKLKLFIETGAPLTTGKSYRVRYDLQADEAFDFNVFYNGAAEKDAGEFYDLSAGETQKVEHTIRAGSDAPLTIQLMLGKSGAPNSVTVSNVEVDEIDDGTAPSPQHAPINFWAHEDYTASLTNTDSSASLAISSVPETGREAWKIKLFAETGAKLETGKTYRISIDVQSTAEQDFEICYNNVAAEKELGALYGLKASAEKKTLTYNVTPQKDAELILQLNLGNAGGKNTVTISGIRVEEITASAAESVLPSFSYDSVGSFSSAADAGYIVSLDKAASSATFRILQAPASDRNPWNVKLNVRTGFTPEKDKGYRVSFDLNAALAQSAFEVFYDGNTESAYGAQYGQSLSSGKNSFSYIIYPGESKGELVLQLRCGKTDGTAGNTYTFSNLKIDEVTFRYTQTPETKEVTTLVTQNGYIEQLERTRDRATVRIEKSPSEGREAWKSKLFVETGVTLRPGQKYRVSMDVKSIIPTPFEVCFNNGGVEKGLGAMFGLISTPSGQHVEYITYAKEATQLVIQLSLGNCAPPNSIMLSNVKVEKAGAIDLVSDTIYTF